MISPRCSRKPSAPARPRRQRGQGHVVAIENDFVVVDVGLKTEGRVPLKEFAAPGTTPSIKVGDIVEVYLERIEDKHGEAVLSPREGPPRGSLDPAREGVPGQRARHRRDLRPRQGRLHRRSRRRRRVPARQPGRHPPGARRRPADGHAAAVPDPEDGPRRGNIVVSRRAVLEESRAEERTELVASLQGRPGARRRGEEHHRLRRVRRSRRRRRPAARHRHRVAARQPPDRSAERSARPSRCRSSRSTRRPSASASA